MQECMKRFCVGGHQNRVDYSPELTTPTSSQLNFFQPLVFSFATLPETPNFDFQNSCLTN